jgi:elongation factor Tu
MTCRRAVAIALLALAASPLAGSCQKQEAPAPAPAPARRHATPRPTRAPSASGPFLMPVEDVFSIQGRGTIATGRIERGTVKVGDEVEIVGINAPMTAVVDGVEMFRKMLDEARAGDNVGILLRDVKRVDVQRGKVLAKPGSIRAHRRFKADAKLMTREEGGGSRPFFERHHPQFWFRTADFSGVIRLPAGVKALEPGDEVTMEIELLHPAPCEVGMRFAIREGGKTVGAGVVTELVD